MYLKFLFFVLQLSVMIGKGTSQSFSILCEAGMYSNGTSSGCTDCEPGKYKTGNNFATRCTDCTPGKYAKEAKAVECEQCAVGFYSNSGKSDCSGCQRGYFQNKIGQSSCQTCKPGKYTNMGTSEVCMHCPEGKYQNEEAQLQCRDCPGGWQQMAPGSSSCKACKVGTYERRDDGPPTCLNCNVGQYQNETAQQECKECPLGYTNVMEQSSFCRKCPTSVESIERLCRGWGLDDSTEYVACPPGKYSDGLSTTTCLDCESGWISVKDKATEGYDRCQLCGSGTGVNVDQTLCVGCPAGLYSNNGICSVCRPGTFSNETGSSHCRACLAGTYFNGTVQINQTVTVCDSCPRGWSTDALTGAANCSRCSGSSKSHVKQAQCTAVCPESVSTSVVGSDNECDTCAVGHQFNGLQCVSCPSGTYKDAAVPTCHYCPTGFVSAGNRATCERCELGQVPQNNTNCEHCVSGKYQNSYLSCEDCPQGFSQSNNGALLCDACAAGKHQNQSGQHSCDACNSGQYQPTTSQSICFSCPNGYVSTAGFATCLVCPLGFGSQNGACVGCVPGKGSLPESLLGTCVDCPAGQYSLNKVCTPCSTNTYQDVAGNTSCKHCETNRFSAEGATFCSNCAAGTYSAPNNSCVDCVSGQYRGVDDPENECITCPIGFKANISGSLSGTVNCDPCPEGTEANGESCTDCPIGFFGKAGVCVSCLAGYYQDQIGQGACIACATFQVSPAGSLSSDSCQDCDTGLYTIVKNGFCEVCPHGKMYDGTTHVIGDCTSCPVGWEVATKTTCQKCAKNEFSDQGTYCQSCPTGFSTRSAGSSHCAKCIDGDCDGVCPEGEYLSKDSCKYCPSGYVSLGGYQNKCFECTKGTYQPEPSKSRCLLCETGRFSAIGANILCHLCAKGQYQPEEAQSDCLDCLPGKYSELTGQNECKYCRLGQFTERYGTSDSSECNQCPAGKMGTFGGHCVDCPESTWQNEPGQSNCKKCPLATGTVPYSQARSTREEDCFDIDGIVSYVFGMKDDGKRAQTLDTSCEIRPNMVLYCPSCTCKSDVRDGYWDGPLCDECQRGFAGGQVGKCLIKCPGYDGVHDSTMCNGNGKCWYGKHGSGECLCGGKNILDSTSDNVVVSVKTCPAGQQCPGYGTDISPTTAYKPLYYLLEYRQYSVFVLQMNTHTPKRGHMWFERYSPQNIYENVCSTCVGKYDKTPYTEIGYFNSQNDYAKFQPQLQLDNGFHGENCQYECAVCLNNGKCLNTPHSFYYNYAIESADSLSQPVFLPQTQCICSSSIYDGDAMCCPYGFEPYVYFGKRDVKPYFQYTALPLITNIVNRQMSYWTDEDLWLSPEHSLTYNEPDDHQISVSNINQIYTNDAQVVSANYDTTGPYTKHTFYGTEKDICRACPGLFGKGVRSRSRILETASEAEDFWWDSAAAGKKCNGVGVCDFYSQKRQADVLFMGEYKTDNKNNKFQLHQRYTSCRDIVNDNTKVVNKVELTECINQTVAIGATAFVYSEPYAFIYDETQMPVNRNTYSEFPLTKPLNFGNEAPYMNRHGYISTVLDGERKYVEVLYSGENLQHIPTPNANGDYIFHPWDENDCQIVLPNQNCIMTDKVDYSLYKVGQTGQGDERYKNASFDRFDTCLTYDDGTFKTKIGNYITTTYENGEDPFLGNRCPTGHFCTKTGTGTDTVGYKEACPPGYFQPEWGVTRTTADVHCSRMDTEDTDNCDQNLATLQSDYVDKKCQRCQPNQYAPEGSPSCTDCPVGRVKKLSGNIPESVLQSMYNIPISLDGTYWYYMEDETGFELSDCALVPNGIVHVPEADRFMTTDEPKFLPVFPCPFSYSSRPGTFVIHGHELVTSLLEQKTNVISAPFANVDTTQGEEYAEVQQWFAKDHCFICPSSSITGHGSTTCTTCFQDRTAFTTKEIIQSIVEHEPSKFPDRFYRALTNKVNLIDSTNLVGARGVVVSPDGKNVYVVAYNSNSIVHWDRDTATGALTNQVNLTDSTNLYCPNSVAVSPDGKNIYAVASQSDSIVHWDRDSATGALSNQVNLIDSTHLNKAGGVAVSPDGKNVYAVAQSSHSIVHWDRDSATGALTNQVNLRDYYSLKSAVSVVVSPDGKNVYAVAFQSDSIVHWDRDSTTGALSNQVNHQVNQEEYWKNNLNGAGNVAVSPDGKNIFVTAFLSGTIVYWDRDSATGALTNHVDLIDETLYPDSVIVSPDGKNVYAVGFFSNSIVHWDRDTEADISSNLTSYDHWATNFNHVPIVDVIYSRNHREGLTVETTETISLAELLGYCHYHYPNYIGVAPNIRIGSAPDMFKHTCVESVNNDDNVGIRISQQIYMKIDGNWSTQYPLCRGCESGKFNDPLIVGKCSDCEPGKYTATMAEASLKTCQPCPSGTYTSQIGQRQCTSCPSGWSQNDVGQAACNGCEPGQYQNQERQPTCKDCAVGTWSITTLRIQVCDPCLRGQRYVSKTAACIACDSPTYMDEAGNIKTNCKVCDPGKKFTRSDQVCEKCPKGKMGTTDKECKNCVPGQYQKQDGQPECASCGGGQFQKQFGGEKCEECAVGYYVKGENNQTKCEPAGPGKQVTIQGASKPESCKENYFKDWEGKPACEACPAGYRNSRGNDRTQCEKCLSGQFGDEKGTGCKQCPNGKYQPEEGLYSCIVCPGPKTTYGKSSSACAASCGSGKIVSADPPSNHVRGTCHDCRYEKKGEYDCYCKHHENKCLVKGVAELVCMFGICL